MSKYPNLRPLDGAPTMEILPPQSWTEVSSSSPSAAALVPITDVPGFSVPRPAAVIEREELIRHNWRTVAEAVLITALAIGAYEVYDSFKAPSKPSAIPSYTFDRPMR